MVSKPSRILFNAEFPTSLSKALIESHCCGRSMAGFGNIRKGRREAVDNLAFTEGGDCPRCGGESQPSTMNGYLSCVACQHEWKDPNHVDSDIFDSKVNLKGIAFKGQYMIEDNVKFNVAYAYGEINDKSVGCTPGLGDLPMCMDSMDLIQLDMTYKW